MKKIIGVAILLAFLFWLFSPESEQRYNIKFENKSNFQKNNARLYYGEKWLSFGNFSPNVLAMKSGLTTVIPQKLKIEWTSDDGVLFEQELSMSEVPERYDGFVLHFSFEGVDGVSFIFYQN